MVSKGTAAKGASATGAKVNHLKRNLMMTEDCSVCGGEGLIYSDEGKGKRCDACDGSGEHRIPLTAAVARMMAGPNPTEEEAEFWDAWKDEMKEGDL